MTYYCANASGAIGCLPLRDSVATPLAPQNCTNYQGSTTTGNGTHMACNPTSNPNASTVVRVPVLNYKFYATGSCATTVIVEQTNQTSYCDTATGMNLFGQCENRSGTVVLATYACGSSCSANLSTANCIDLTGSAVGIVDGACNAFSATAGGRFSCQGPLVDATISVTPTVASASFTPTVASSTPLVPVPTSATPVSSSGTKASPTSAATVASTPSGPTSAGLPTSATASVTPTKVSPTVASITTKAPTPKGAAQLTVGLALAAGLAALL